jgi:hypothetical protein
LLSVRGALFAVKPERTVQADMIGVILPLLLASATAVTATIAIARSRHYSAPAMNAPQTYLYYRSNPVSAAGPYVGYNPCNDRNAVFVGGNYAGSDPDPNIQAALIREFRQTSKLKAKLRKGQTPGGAIATEAACLGLIIYQPGRGQSNGLNKRLVQTSALGTAHERRVMRTLYSAPAAVGAILLWGARGDTPPRGVRSRWLCGGGALSPHVLNAPGRG